MISCVGVVETGCSGSGVANSVSLQVRKVKETDATRNRPLQENVLLLAIECFCLIHVFVKGAEVMAQRH